jgi:hypothetical protein
LAILAILERDFFLFFFAANHLMPCVPLLIRQRRMLSSGTESFLQRTTESDQDILSEQS